MEPTTPCASVRVLISVRLHTRHMFLQIIIFDIRLPLLISQLFIHLCYLIYFDYYIFILFYLCICFIIIIIIIINTLCSCVLIYVGILRGKDCFY